MQNYSDPRLALPAGWVTLGGVLTPDPTVTGHIARGQEVKGVCYQGDCRRRCELDLARLARQGFGAMAVRTATALMRCHNLTGCGLDFHEDRRTGLPLRALVGRAHVKVRIRCGGCGFSRTAPPESVIARLSKPEPMPGNLYISEIAGRIKGACGQCKKRAWTVDILWPDPRSEGYRRVEGRM